MELVECVVFFFVGMYLLNILKIGENVMGVLFEVIFGCDFFEFVEVGLICVDWFFFFVDGVQVCFWNDEGVVVFVDV